MLEENLSNIINFEEKSVKNENIPENVQNEWNDFWN